MTATKVDLSAAEQVQGTLPVANGGTGNTTLAGAGIELTANKNAASGYAGLNSSGYVAPTQLGSGTANSTTFLRGDNTYAVPAGGGSGSITPTANTIAEWDGNVNLSANNVLEGLATVVTAAGTTALTITSAENQVFTGSSTQTVTLPTTSVPAGTDYTIINQSTGAVTVNASGGATICVLAGQASAPYVSAVFTSTVATPTTAAQWSWNYGARVASGKAPLFNNTITFAGTDATTMTFPTTSATIARTDAANTFTGVQTMTSPNFTTPVLGTPSSGVLTNCTGGPTLTSATLTTVKSYTETVQSVGTVTASKTLPVLANGTMMTALLTAATTTTFTMPTAVAGASFVLRLQQASTPSGLATFTGVIWPNGATYIVTGTASYYDILTFFCFDGTHWDGNYSQSYSA